MEIGLAALFETLSTAVTIGVTIDSVTCFKLESNWELGYDPSLKEGTTICCERTMLYVSLLCGANFRVFCTVRSGSTFTGNQKMYASVFIIILKID